MSGSFSFNANPLVSCRLITDYISYLSMKYPQRNTQDRSLSLSLGLCPPQQSPCHTPWGPALEPWCAQVPISTLPRGKWMLQEGRAQVPGHHEPELGSQSQIPGLSWASTDAATVFVSSAHLALPPQLGAQEQSRP